MEANSETLLNDSCPSCVLTSHEAIVHDLCFNSSCTGIFSSAVLMVVLAFLVQSSSGGDGCINAV